MTDHKIIKRGLVNAIAALAYIGTVVTLLKQVERIFGNKEDGPLAPVAFLLLLVVSAATMGMLVFGKPLMLYIDGSKKEAVAMVVWTIGSLAVFTLAVFAVMALMM